MTHTATAALSRAAWEALLRRERTDRSAPAPLQAERARVRGHQGSFGVYLGYLTEHLECGRVDLGLALMQWHWLEGLLEEKRLPAEWFIATLELQNHRGVAVGDEGAALDKLLEGTPRRWLEAARDLRLAVRDTNAMRFAEADRRLAGWMGARGDAEHLDVLYGARLRSAAGQVYAFQGRAGLARFAFDAALSVFEGLPQDPQGDVLRTRIYRAIAVMDDPRVSDAEALEALEALLTPADKPRKLCPLVSQVVGDRASGAYLHHVVARYLVHRGGAAEQACYLRESASLTAERGHPHPWALISLYRALMLRGQGQTPPARALLEAAIDDLSREGQGPTLRLIALTLDGVLRRWGAGRRQFPDQELADLLREIPAASGSLQALSEPLAHASDLDLVRAVLPFNFR
ncbi:MAG: hypothetical protein JXX28_10960 [Deltaproteobacteria bacterium]|nr:hypothetical protein [Deltaproteobacteria bacterium]